MKSHLSTSLLVLGAALTAAAQEDAGARIYRTLCASCHGADGQGAKDHPEPLVGDRPLEKLAQYIDKKMPEDAPGKCVGEDARKVAEYIYKSFYSLEARLRNKPPRIEISRLTVRQYRETAADLAGSFAAPAPTDDRHGLRGEYFNAARRFRDEARSFERLDPGIDFDFGGATPAEEINADEFSIRWTGALVAPETGEYEIVLASENGVRLFLNDESRSLIDGLVRSGPENARRETVALLGGRSYPLRVEFIKGKKDKSASVALRWKPPRRAEELVPARNLRPVKVPEVLVVKTPFPPDDRSMGYERGTSVSKAWDEATTYAAIEVAGHVLTRLDALAGGKERAREFAARFAERAFRRPLTPEQREFFVDRHFAAGEDPAMALRKVLLLVLKSPRFLYAEFGAPERDAYDVASRISFGLWDSLPDPELLEAARTGRLSTAAEVTRQVERMLPDPRTRSKLRAFYHLWLQLDRLHEVSKDAKRYPEFNEAVVSDLRTSLDLLLDDVTWSGPSDFRQLLLADFVYLNGRLARVYGAKLPADAPFQKVPLGQAGLLTHPLLMAGFAYDATTSPIHRGVFVARSFLGRRLRPPPEAQTPLSPQLHPDMTTRERILLQTKPQACQSCHAMINPLGFAFENFDAVGRFRTEERGRPIDASGEYWTLAGESVRFKGARELGEYLARSEETQTAFIEQLFHYVVKQPILAHGSGRPDALRAEFSKSGFSIRKLLVDIVVTSALAEGKHR